MVEAVGVKPTIDKVVRVAAPQATTPVQVATSEQTVRQSAADVATLSGAAKDLAAEPPVDSDRVATIRRAIANGEFPILPATIADRLIAFKLEWNGREQA